MVEPWKTVLCDSKQCIAEVFKPLAENTKASTLNQDALEEYKIYPDIDNELVTQFTCPRCGKVTTWGKTRREVAKTLYERFSRRIH